jgi:hypothetical protein
LLLATGAEEVLFGLWPHPDSSSAMPATTVAPRKPAANPNGSQERKDDVRVIARPPVYERKCPSGGHARIVPPARDADSDPTAIAFAGGQSVTHPTFATLPSGMPHPAAAGAPDRKVAGGPGSNSFR